MKRKIKYITIVATLVLANFMAIVSSSSFVVSSNFLLNENSNIVKINVLDGGYIEEIDGIKILHINGSYYNMGYQHGTLLKKEIQENLRCALSYAALNGITEKQLRNAWNYTKEYMPDEIIEEFQGISDGANVSFYEINYINLIPMLFHTDFPKQCSGFAAWGSATSDGELVMVSSNDVNLQIEDPVTGKRPQENLVLVIRTPDDGYSSMYPAYAGYYGWNGINSEGIGVCTQASWCSSTTYKGIPIKYRNQLALDKASTAEEAVNTIISNKTIGYNVIVSDAKVPLAYVVEMNGNMSYIGTYDNPCESTEPFWQINNVIRRTNFYISKTLADDQRSIYSIKNPILMLLGKNSFYPFWRIYLGLSKGIKENYGQMDLDCSLKIMQDTYNGNLDSIISLIQKIGVVRRIAEKTSFLQSLIQFSAYPKTGDIAVCFSSRDKCAYENPAHHFNLFELID